MIFFQQLTLFQWFIAYISVSQNCNVLILLTLILSSPSTYVTMDTTHMVQAVWWFLKSKIFFIDLAKVYKHVLYFICVFIITQSYLHESLVLILRINRFKLYRFKFGWYQFPSPFFLTKFFFVLICLHCNVI